MKKVISILILILLLFFVVQWGVGFIKKEHEVSYQILVGDTVFEVHELYQKEYGDAYDIMIQNGSQRYSYSIPNQYNKQKNIIQKIEYYQEGDNYCIYPVLKGGKGTYLECVTNGTLYTDLSFPNQDFISRVKVDLQEKGYHLSKNYDLNNTTTVGDTIIYLDSLLSNDIIALWNYKGIEIIKPDQPTVRDILGFDKYENSHGYLVGKYYVLPNYLSSKVLEFSSVTIVDVETNKIDTIELNNTLSSDTYINGVIDGKLYYTDPSNLLQIEINPNTKSARLIGSKDLGGQLYQGEWQDVNIYDFATQHLLFQEDIPKEIDQYYSYHQLLAGDMNYYFYTDHQEVYRVSKNHLDLPILLFKDTNLNNMWAVKNTIYFIVDDTLYYYEEGGNLIPVLKNNELRYNTINRIGVYRKS